MVVVSAGHVVRTHGSGIVSSVADVLWMRGVGEICEMRMCLARATWVERGCVDERIGFGLFQSC